MKDLLARNCFRGVLIEWALYIKTGTSPEDFSWFCENLGSERKRSDVGKAVWELGKLIRGRSWEYLRRRMPVDLDRETKKQFRKAKASAFFIRFKKRYTARIDEYLKARSA